MHWALIGKESPGTRTGGLNRYVEGFLPALRSAGETVDAYFLGDSAGIVTRLFAVRLLRALLSGLKASNVDVVDSHFAMYGAPFVLGVALDRSIRRRRMPQVVVHFHGPWGDESAVAAGGANVLAVRTKRAMEKWLLSRADKVIVLTETFAKEAVRAGARGDRVKRLAPGVDSVWTTVVPRPESDLAPLNLLCVRRLTQRMGHEPLIRLLHQFDFSVDDRSIRLHVVGDGELRQRLQHVTRSLGCERSVQFHGRLTDEAIRELAGSCGGAVVPTTALEGFGLVVLESMAMGLPVISTGQGGLSEAMGPWARRPFIFSLSDRESLETSIRELMSDRWVETSGEVRSYAAEHAWHAVVDRTLVEVSS